MGASSVASTGPESREAHARRGSRVCMALLLLITLACYVRVGGFEFVLLDDEPNVVQNERLRPPDLERVAAFWTTPYNHLYVPLSYTVWSLETRLAEGAYPGAAGTELSPTVFHLAQLVRHLACVLLVFLILRRLTASRWAACAGAALFALHPLQVESVAWVSETRGLLAGLFALLALWLHLGPDGAGGRRRSVLAGIFVALACLSKPSAIALPGIALVLDVLVLERPLGRSLRSLVPWFVAVLPCALVTRALQAGESLAFEVPALWQRPWVAADALGFYLRKLCWPFGLAPDYGRSPARVMELGWRDAAWALPIIVALVLVFLRSRKRALACLAVFVVGVGPVLGLVPFAYQGISTVADRYVYLSMLGPALGLAFLLASVRSRIVAGVVVLCLVALGVRSWNQTGYWKDSRALLEHTLAVNPRSPVAHNNLGIWFERQLLIEPAVAHYRRALELEPRHFSAYLNLASAQLERGHRREARQWLLGALAVRADPRPQAALEQIHGEIAQMEATSARLRSRIEESPGDAAAHLALARTQQDLGYPRVAAAQYREALRLRPDAATAMDLAWLLATAADPSVRDGNEALERGEEALEMDGGRMPGVLFALAAAHAELGDAAGGVELARQALSEARASAETRLIPRIEAWIRLIEEGYVPHGRKRLSRSPAF